MWEAFFCPIPPLRFASTTLPSRAGEVMLPAIRMLKTKAIEGLRAVLFGFAARIPQGEHLAFPFNGSRFITEYASTPAT